MISCILCFVAGYKYVFSPKNAESQINILRNKFELKVQSSTNCTQTTEYLNFRLLRALTILKLQHWITVEGELHAQSIRYKTLAHFLRTIKV